MSDGAVSLCTMGQSLKQLVNNIAKTATHFKTMPYRIPKFTRGCRPVLNRAREEAYNRSAATLSRKDMGTSGGSHLAGRYVG